MLSMLCKVYMPYMLRVGTNIFHPFHTFLIIFVCSLTMGWLIYISGNIFFSQAQETVQTVTLQAGGERMIVCNNGSLYTTWDGATGRNQLKVTCVASVLP